ncbi:transcriptional regulator [Pontibacter qinzhouensis]|uniref:Transcriptional regulator n=1 Tax=Pontibacter qinzhouensis TaxID=2603253 RepID=A0A5C8K3N8_9BACT|nr:DegT/DnrJ/EryC1/StrS family aminotransferase [Pontibacter qinzhouensis]TXK44870.1 transcriptional regulator [Pontibacter qinzhouensis]
MEDIKMSNRKALYAKLKPELDQAFLAAMGSADLPDGPDVIALAQQLEEFLQVPGALPCAHGAEAMQLALAALDLPAGAEVIVPAFGGHAAAAALAQLGLRPVLADVHPQTFTITPDAVAAAVSEKTVAVVVVHLFGQCAAMAALLQVAANHNLLVVEDVTQALGATYTFTGGSTQYAGAMGAVAYTSFFPAKPNDPADEGGAVFTSKPEIASRLNEWLQNNNSLSLPHAAACTDWRLPNLQAAMVRVKLKYLPELLEARQQVAARYTRLLATVPDCQLPTAAGPGAHVFQHYSIRVPTALRNGLQAHLQEHFIPSMIYYPEPQLRQHASAGKGQDDFPEAERLHQGVLSLALHTELTEEQQAYICHHIATFLAPEHA